ncbi:hypothetical protein [Cryptosporangium minutisporangium]|uniref:Integral membrane protein n=1 Tax=Cryptosporangium minutisporangium TaxID=113569 RepID=A0ABP6T356_9ACTN
MSEATVTDRRTTVSTKNKAGLVLASLLAIGDLVGLLIPVDTDEPGPPLAVLAVGAVMGVITLAAAVYTWRTGNRIGARVVAATRIFSALGALPAFFVEDVPAPLVIVAAVGVVLTLVAVLLVLSRPEPA